MQRPSGFLHCKRHGNPNLDAEKLESLITPRTRVIAPVHYAGVACNMDAIMAVAEKHNLLVVEDAAQAIDLLYKGKPLGGVGHLGAFSFHETKNITAGGEGELLTINDEHFIRRAEIIWEKGTKPCRVLPWCSQQVWLCGYGLFVLACRNQCRLPLGTVGKPR